MTFSLFLFYIILIYLKKMLSHIKINKNFLIVMSWLSNIVAPETKFSIDDLISRIRQGLDFFFFEI